MILSFSNTTRGFYFEIMLEIQNASETLLSSTL